jgi:hypothetical protein
VNKENVKFINRELINMRLMNIIKDEDEMKYIFPSRDVYLIIKREYSNIPVPNGPNYIIIISVYGIYGNKMFDIKTDEVNIARIVDCMNYFNSELGGYGDSMDIELSPFDSNSFEFIYFSLERIPSAISVDEMRYPNGDPVYAPYIQDTMDIFDIKFEIKKYSKPNETLTVMYSTLLNTSSLDELSYSLFFVSLIDLDPNDYNSRVEYDYMYEDSDPKAYINSKNIDFDSLDQTMERVLYNRYNTLEKRILNSNVKVNTYNNSNKLE